ncbi:MAG TPA: ATP-binding protein [Pseudolabrys sp.]|nr:ATP-binding protein [Pseudolabrys sp.]
MVGDTREPAVNIARSAPPIHGAELAHAARVSMLGELTTSIAHEVSQPLCAIVANAEASLRLLSCTEPNVIKVGQLTARIAESARHASDIVTRIRGMAAKHASEKAPLDLNEIVDAAILFVRHDLDSRSIRLSARFAPDLPDVVGDRIQLQQVVINLLVNSIQAIAGGCGSLRQIELSTVLDGSGAVVFSIHDSGPGIRDDHLGRIFESFFTTKETGVGIGLAICRSIIAAHGGDMTASNHPDGGAQFQFRLPAPARAQPFRKCDQSRPN